MYRKQRIGDLLQSFLAEEIRRMSDPRLDFVTLTEVRPARDLKSATVFWSVPAGATESGEVAAFPAEDQRRESSAALFGATKYLKKRVGEELTLRYVPDLQFVYDESAETGSRIEELLEQAGFSREDEG